METQHGKQSHLAVGSGAPGGREPTECSLSITEPPQSLHTSLPLPAPSHSTPLSPPTSHSRRRVRRKRMRGGRVHPAPHPLSLSTMTPTDSPSSSPPTSLPASLTSSLPPLLTSQLSRGESTQSSSTDWSSDGGVELDRRLPGRQLGLCIATWNMRRLNILPSSLEGLLLPAGQEVVSEMCVVGTQESTGQRREWEILVQQTLGPSHLLIHSASLGEIYLLFFLKRDLLWFCSEVQSIGYSTRPGSMVKTKGGVGISFSLFGNSFLFITSHFTAHREKVEERNLDMQRIATNITRSRLSEFDYVFWLGDLNYRLDLERSAVDQHLSHPHPQDQDQDDQGGWQPLLLHDQLTKEMLQGHVFRGFSEQPITFPPSYKFDLNSDSYDSSGKQRVPSWTDRILFHSRTGSGISGCGYNSCQSLQGSDHRAVCGVFNVRLEPPANSDGVPEVMAEFNREVYRIARQRRKEEEASVSLSLRDEADRHRTSNKHVTTAVCSIL